MAKYDFKKIEKKWQKEWERQSIGKAVDFSKKKKWYSLIEFPYPSGQGLHIGHIRSLTAMDIISRKRRMEGYNVLYPIGWDAFGLPTENYAIKTGVDPRVATKKNTDTFRKQLKGLGFSFDWSREVNTTDPKYYRWTQWLFLQFFKKGLAYKAEIDINWCPNDKIGLANEEVIGGKCERCGAEVEKRKKAQWMLKITAYADKLLKGLEKVDYLDEIKAQQINWIGKSEGALIDFELPDASYKIQVFTTRPDTLFGATYLVLAPEHELVAKLKNHISNFKEVEAYVKTARKETEEERTAENKEKTGVELKGVKAVNPATGGELPVWIADYVLAEYGTGAIMAVPAHDERDYDFAKKFNLPVTYVIAPYFLDEKDPPRKGMPMVFRKAVNCYIKNPKTGKYLFLEWKATSWKGPVSGGIEEGEDAVGASLREIREETGYTHLRFKRYLGSPIRADFYHPAKKENRAAEFIGLLFELEDETREAVEDGERDRHVPVWIPEEEALKFLNTGMTFFERIFEHNLCYTDGGRLVNSGKFSDMDSEKAKGEITKFVGGKKTVNYHLRDWVFSRQRYWGEPIPIIHCEKCGYVPVPENNLPVVLPSVKNYQPRDDGESPLASVSSWVNVKCPKCKNPAKRETDTMPNWAGSSWYFLRYADPKNSKEFASMKKLNYWMPIDWYNGGMEHVTLHLLYSRFWNIFLHDQGLVPTSEPYRKRTAQGMILGEGGVKMSKSKGNVVNPDTIVHAYGADVARIYEMFMGPFDRAIAWDAKGIEGVKRFLWRVWDIARGEKISRTKNEKLEKLLAATVKKVGEDIEKMAFHTAVSAMMIFINAAGDEEIIPVRVWSDFLKILAPFAPHLADELWYELKNKKSVHLESWPAYDPKLLKEDTVEIVVQVNGKRRGSVFAAADAGEDEVKKAALGLPNVAAALGGAAVKKVVYVKGRIINLVM